VKIRNKITLWITGAGLLASSVFSAVVFEELIEQPYELLDAELDNRAHDLPERLFLPGELIQVAGNEVSTVAGLYWLKILDEQQRTIYSSDLVQLVDLPLRKTSSSYTIKTTLLKSLLIPEPDEEDEDDQDHLAFRVRVVPLEKAGHHYTVQIARPMDRLDEEVRELLLTLALGMAGSAIVLLVVGYLVAGRILRPISTITSTARKINDRTLDQRLPLGKTKDELHVLSSALNTMFDRLQHSFRLQKEFIASAAHELKTPLTVIRLFLEETQGREDLPQEVKKRMVCQNKILSRMERLVKNLLDLSKLELKQSFQPGRFDLTELVSEVFEDFETSIDLARLHLTIDMEDGLLITADRDMIRQALINIIDNGIKYNRQEKGEIRFAANIRKKKLTITLANTGEAISEDDLSRVFEQFYRVEKSRSTSHGGSGLGLAIVRQIILRHQGTITMESRDSWITVRIVLPADQM